MTFIHYIKEKEEVADINPETLKELYTKFTNENFSEFLQMFKKMLPKDIAMFYTWLIENEVEQKTINKIFGYVAKNL